MLRRARVLDCGHVCLDKMHDRARTRLGELWRDMRSVSLVLWMDNYVRQLNPIDPARGRSRVMSVTVCRVLKVANLTRSPLLYNPPLPLFSNVFAARRGAVQSVLAYFADLLPK